jgi:hypothetical protein
MPPRPLKPFALVVLAVLATGCPKPPPPAPPPEPSAEAGAAAPPPPKCESLSEKCTAKADTRAKITNSDLVFTPTTGWLYAQQSSATVAQTTESGPGFALLGIEIDLKDVKKEVASKDAAVTELVKQLGLVPLKRKVAWKKPDDHEAVGPIKLELWQLEEGARGAKKGPILIVAASTGDGKVVVGVGFVPADDESGADKTILASIKSLGKAL